MVTSWPLPSLAAALVTQWQAVLTSRRCGPPSKLSKAPDLICAASAP